MFKIMGPVPKIFLLEPAPLLCLKFEVLNCPIN